MIIAIHSELTKDATETKTQLSGRGSATPDDGPRHVLSVSIAEFQVKCLKLVSEVADSGSEIVITRNGQPVSRLVRIRKRPPAPFGRDQELIQIHGDIAEPMDADWEADSNPNRVPYPWSCLTPTS